MPATLLSRDTLKKRLREAVMKAFVGVAAVADNGSYQSPKQSALLAAVDHVPAKGLAKMKDVKPFVDEAERARTPQYSGAAGGRQYEKMEHKLTLSFTIMDPEHLLSPEKLDALLTRFTAAVFDA